MSGGDALNGAETPSLAARLERLFERPGFWRERWRAAGLARAPESLEGLAPVGAAELAADETANPPYGTWRAATDFVRVGVPAREGPLEMVVFTATDLELEARVGAATLAAAGLAPGRRETNTLPGGLATPGSLVVGDAAQALGALDMPVGQISAAGPRDVAFDFWQRVRPDFAVVDERGAADLAELLGAKGTSAPGIGIRAAALVTDLRDAEPRVPDLGVPTTRVVGLAEAFSLLAASDTDGVYRVPAGEVLVEVVDGELLLTTLRHSAALIRYAPGVTARLVSVEARGDGVAFALV